MCHESRFRIFSLIERQQTYSQSNLERQFLDMCWTYGTKQFQWTNSIAPSVPFSDNHHDSANSRKLSFRYSNNFAFVAEGERVQGQ